MRHENSSILELDGKEVSEFTPSKPREKWLRKRTHVKIRVGVLSTQPLETVWGVSLVDIVFFSGLTERDCKPSYERRGVHGGQPAGRDWSLYVRPSGHGDSGWREGELFSVPASHAQLLFLLSLLSVWRSSADWPTHHDPASDWRVVVLQHRGN